LAGFNFSQDQGTPPDFHALGIEFLCVPLLHKTVAQTACSAPKTHSLHLKIPLYTSKQSKKMVWPIIGAEGYVGETGQVNETEK
jgi:hypothetical protein